MNLALLLPHKLFLGLRRMVHLLQADAPQPLRPKVLAQRPSQHRQPTPMPAAGSPMGRSNVGAAASRPHAGVARRPAPCAAPQTGTRVMPLRVLRVVEKGQPVCSSGRMVISGRMADVCAELDRLAARELALQ